MDNQERESIILIVEDDEINGETLALIIASETGYHPSLVSTGEDAIKAVQKTRPALLLIDYNLPGMDGIQTYEQIRAMRGLEKIPAIFLSATGNLDSLKAHNLPTIEKPYELDELLTLIETHMMPNALQENNLSMLVFQDGSALSGD